VKRSGRWRWCGRGRRPRRTQAAVAQTERSPAYDERSASLDTKTRNFANCLPRYWLSLRGRSYSQWREQRKDSTVSETALDANKQKTKEANSSRTTWYHTQGRLFCNTHTVKHYCVAYYSHSLARLDLVNKQFSIGFGLLVLVFTMRFIMDDI